MSCPYCGCENYRTVLTPELRHYGKDICDGCDRFLRWIPNPENNAKREENARRIRVLVDKRMKPMEREFILSLEGQGPKISPKQQDWLDSLWERYGP